MKEPTEATAIHLRRRIVNLIEQYRRDQIMELSNQAYAEMRSNPEIWAEELDERRVWEATLADGIVELDEPDELAWHRRVPGTSAGTRRW